MIKYLCYDLLNQKNFKNQYINRSTNALNAIVLICDPLDGPASTAT